MNSIAYGPWLSCTLLSTYVIVLIGTFAEAVNIDIIVPKDAQQSVDVVSVGSLRSNMFHKFSVMQKPRWDAGAFAW